MDGLCYQHGLPDLCYQYGRSALPAWTICASSMDARLSALIAHWRSEAGVSHR